MKHIWTDKLPSRQIGNQRQSERRAVSLPARLMWKDRRGTPRFASVLTRNVSDHGVYVEARSAVAIPLYRLVQFQFEREVRNSDLLPESLRQGRVLSAVYRIASPEQWGGAHGFALRLLVDPRRQAFESSEVTRATA